MSKSAQSLFVFGIYLFTIGIIFIIIPNVFLRLFFFPETNEVWLRVVGMLLLILGFYDCMAAKTEMKQFFQWSVYARAPVLPFFIIFVALGFAPPMLIVFGVIDGAAALWTHLALRSEKQV